MSVQVVRLRNVLYNEQQSGVSSTAVRNYLETPPKHSNWSHIT